MLHYLGIKPSFERDRPYSSSEKSDTEVGEVDEKNNYLHKTIATPLREYILDSPSIVVLGLNIQRHISVFTVRGQKAHTGTD
jgi:hypothetical protein